VAPMNVLSTFPDQSQMVDHSKPFDLNGHIHTPYSFSAFKDIGQAFEMARKENIRALGINDFVVTDGYGEFHDKATISGIFPLFNIEFIGLLKEAQADNIRINDPSNPGRIYFSGKGLDYPSEPDGSTRKILEKVREEGNAQVEAMVSKLNDHIKTLGLPIRLDYGAIRNNLARLLVRERHVARALRMEIFKAYTEPVDRINMIATITGVEQVEVDIRDEAALENFLRAKLLKKGGAAFVAEDDQAFLELHQIKDIIVRLGGIPCYPVLLDDASGNITEFERDYESLADALESLGIFSVELIPNRNDFAVLKGFVEFFRNREFLITFGTEHNTPALTPLRVHCRHDVSLDDSLKKISWEGASVIAAHQYLRAKGQEGYVDPKGLAKVDQYSSFVDLGSRVFSHYFNLHP